MAEKVTRETADKLKAIPGNVRGVVILADAAYIRQQTGEEGIKKTEQRLQELGCPFLFKEVKLMNYYPEYYSVLIILLAKELMDLDEQGVFEMGRAGLKLSFFMKVLTKYFVSIKRSFEESPKYWQKHFDFGELETTEFNEKKQYGILRVKGYKFHPIMCAYHRGYFLQVAQLILGKRKVTIKETKCMFKGAPYHEYIIRWE